MPRRKKNDETPIAIIKDGETPIAIVRRVKDPDAHFMSVLISKCDPLDNTFLRKIYLDGVRQGLRNIYLFSATPSSGFNHAIWQG